MQIIKGQSTGHITPVKEYVKVLGILLLLTVITVVTAKSHALNETLNGISTFGPIILAMGIAVVKATLVIRNFMHVKYEKTIIWTYGLALPLFLFALLVTMALLDGKFRILV